MSKQVVSSLMSVKISALTFLMLTVFGLPSITFADSKPNTLTPSSTDQVIGLATWREAVITTRNPQPWITLLTEFADWEIRSDQAIDPALPAFWGVDGDVNGRDILLANKGTERGFIRLIHLQGIEQDWIRSDDRPWDTGGIFDINIRVHGLLEKHKQLRDLGWQGDSLPSQIVFGPYEVVEWIARGPDGVRFAFIERIKPTLEGYEFTHLSRVFNSTQTVVDMPTSLAFYRDVLGMNINLEHIGASEKVGPNVLGLPQEITTKVPRIVYILNGKGHGEGSIELLAFDGAKGRDLSAKAAPYNIGLSVLRYVVEDLDQMMTVLGQRGAKFVSDPVEMNMPPYGTVRVVALTAPEGARLEIMEKVE